MRNLIFSIFSARMLRALFCLLLASTLTMAFLRRPPHTPFDQFGDKFEHMLAFTVLTAVAFIAWPQARPLRVVLTLSALGAMIEVFQAIPAIHRDGDWHDWAADTIAILSTAMLVLPLKGLYCAEVLVIKTPLDIRPR